MPITCQGAVSREVYWRRGTKIRSNGVKISYRHSWSVTCCYGLDFPRTGHGAEIDIIVENGLKRVAVESKAGKSPKLSIGTFIAIEDIHPMMTLVVAPIDQSYSMKKGIEIVNISEAIQIIAEQLI